MPSSRRLDPAPDTVRALRRFMQDALLWGLWLAPPALGWLAARGGMGWELVTLLGVLMAVAASLACHHRMPAGRGRMVLGLCLGGVAALGLGAGGNGLPLGVAVVAPVAALALAGALCDRRALLAALAVLVLACLLPLGADPRAVLPPLQLLALALAAVTVVMVQRRLRRPVRMAVLAPCPGVARPVWSLGAAPAVPTGLLVQAERAPDGTLRMAMAAPAHCRARVTIG